MCGGVKGSISVQDANRCGQQLFLANMHFAVASRGEAAHRRQAARASRTPSAKPPSFHAVRHRQLLLFDRERDLAAGRASGFGPPTHPGMARFVDQVLIEHAARHGWGRTTIKAARQGIAIVLSLQDTPGAPMRATEILRLHQIGVPARRLLDVFAAADLLDDDRVPAIHAWFSEQITELPEPMRTELHVWFDVMSNGSPIPPRHRPRSQITTRLYLSWALPALHAWAAAGHATLREISNDDVYNVLPASGNPRSTMGQALRCIFRILKGRKLLFINPIARIKTGEHERRQPLPMQIGIIREALNSADPARAALAALVAFHALRAGELRNLQLTDLRDRRLHVHGRSIPMAGPVRVRVAAWLHYRNMRWPNSANPHLFLNARNAIRANAPGTQWLYLTLGISSQEIREDRILNEIHATGGDVRRVCDLFGLTINAANRYAATVEHPDFTGLGEPD